MKAKTLYLLAGAVLIGSGLFGQSRPDSMRIEITELPLTNALVRYYPLLRDTTGNFPKQLEVTGQIIDITPGMSCGVTCGCGTMQVKPAQPIPGYPHAFVFIAIPCFNVSKPNYLNKTITIRLRLLAKDNKDCYWNTLFLNQIDSRGLPFYIPDNLKERLNVQ